MIYLPSLAISRQTGVELQLFYIRPRPFLVFIAPPFGRIAGKLTHMICDDSGTSVPSFMMIHERGMKLQQFKQKCPPPGSDPPRKWGAGSENFDPRHFLIVWSLLNQEMQKNQF